MKEKPTITITDEAIEGIRKILARTELDIQFKVSAFLGICERIAEGKRTDGHRNVSRTDVVRILMTKPQLTPFFDDQFREILRRPKLLQQTRTSTSKVEKIDIQKLGKHGIGTRRRNKRRILRRGGNMP